MFEALKAKGFEIASTSHAQAILTVDFPTAIKEIERCLFEMELPIAEIIGSGGGEAKSTQWLRRALAGRKWKKTNFVVKKTINGRRSEAISHEVDHVRRFKQGLIALEIEWNNKDPFFDRDLENFKRLHADGAISLGFIITRGAGLQEKLPEFVLRFAQSRNVSSFKTLKSLKLKKLTERQVKAIQDRIDNGQEFADAWAAHFVSDKFGAATTHWNKLMDRMHRGVGNPCPLVLVGLPASIVTFGDGP